MQSHCLQERTLPVISEMPESASKDDVVGQLRLRVLPSESHSALRNKSSPEQSPNAVWQQLGSPISQLLAHNPFVENLQFFF